MKKTSISHKSLAAQLRKWAAANCENSIIEPGALVMMYDAANALEANLTNIIGVQDQPLGVCSMEPDAIQELHQLGYTVREGLLYPSDPNSPASTPVCHLD